MSRFPFCGLATPVPDSAINNQSILFMKTLRFISCLNCLSLAALMCSVAMAAEKLDRGVTALANPTGDIYVGWRLLASDAPNTAFDVLRSETEQGPWQKLNPAPILDSCNFIDSTSGGKAFFYVVRPSTQSDKVPAKATKADLSAREEGCITFKLQGNYRAQKVGLADFDGDGALDFLVKQPNFNTDPYQKPGYWKKSEDTYKLEAYSHDGRFLWRYDMGWAIEEGIWYSPIVAYDVDGDGRAEVYAKGGEGDPREPTGHVTSGPEYLVKIDGRTGKIVQKVPWPSRDGFDEYNYYCRNFLGLAYLDGVRPHLLIERGTYRIIKVQAFDPSLKLKWNWEASGEFQNFRGQGAHGIQVGDIDSDGRDEIVLGSAALDENGVPLWNTRLGHPDACYLADIDPARPGLEIFYGIEPGRKSNAVCLVEAATGKILWGNNEATRHVHGQGMIGDIDPSHPGLECYAGEKDGSNYWLYAASGERLSNKSLGELAPKSIYWTDEPTKALVSRSTIKKYNGPDLRTIKGNIVAIADCLGDWREEIITSTDGEIRVYTTTIPAKTRRVCLMQDRQYRLGVAMQTMGYFYPPQLGGKLFTAQ